MIAEEHGAEEDSRKEHGAKEKLQEQDEHFKRNMERNNEKGALDKKLKRAGNKMSKVQGALTPPNIDSLLTSPDQEGLAEFQCLKKGNKQLILCGCLKACKKGG